jgi:hypothetical protein
VFNIKYYQHTQKFYENLTLQDGELHITQSAALADYLRSKNENAYVFGYKAFTMGIFPEWYHPHTEVYLQSIVREFLQKHVSDSDWKYYEKLVREYYLSVRFLVELGGLQLHDGPDFLLKEEQKLLIALMEQVYQDPIVCQYMTERAELSKESIRKKFGLGSVPSHIFFHHFDYIDGTRMMFFQLLKQIGFKVVFYIPFQQQLTELFKTWKKIYETLSGVTVKQWECVESSNFTAGTKFARYLDKNMNIVDDARNNIKFLHFDHPTSFKDYLKVHPIHKNKYDVITVFEENLNIYTDHTLKDHFYATTYGKFFLSLQNCQKTDQGIVLSYDDYVNMIVSGWVQAGNTNGWQALTLLIDLHDYMEGVTNFQEIMERLQAIVDLQEFGKVFDDLAYEQTGRNRLKKYLSNPFRALPYLHRSRYDITIKQLVECTKDLARKANRLLLRDREKRNVKSYILDIQRIYQSVKNTWEEEAQKKLENLFRIDIPSEWAFEKEELFQLLTFYLASQDEEHKEKIQNFDQLVGKTLSSKHVHVTGLSLKTFPWKSSTLPTLLNHTWLKKCIYQSYISLNREIRLNALLVDYYSRQVTRNTALYTLFHLIAYAKGDITLSFIQDLQESDGPSIYFTILEELYRKDAESVNETSEEEVLWDEEVVKESEEIPLESLEKIPDLIWLDSDFCYKKFFLNAFVEHHPIYEKDFHQQQVFAMVGKMLIEQGDQEEFVHTVFPLFPQWTYTHKQNLIDTAYISGLRSYKSFENIYYPKAMELLQRLYSRYEVTKKWKAKYHYKHDSFNLANHVREFKQNIDTKNIKASSGKHCRMCPFLHVCKEGEYVVDANDN